MKKAIVSLVTVISLVSPVIILAAEPSTPTSIPDWGEVEICCGTGTVLDRIANWAFAILLVVAAIWIIMAGYMFITATGDPDKTKRARDFVLYALIGVLVAFGAKGLVLLVDTIIR